MENGKQKNQLYVIPAAIIVAGIIIAGAVIYSSRNGGFSQPGTGKAAVGTGQPSEASLNVNDLDISGEPFIGDKNAPLTVAYWLDFQCSFCKRFDLQTLPTIVEQYVDTGKVKVVFKDFQFLGPDSQTAGLAAHAVWELAPQKYFEWHQAMLEAQGGEIGNKKDIITLIRTIEGIDADAVARLMEEKKDEYQREQDADRTEGGQFGITGTPGFVIGTQKIAGAQPISVFIQVIDAELGE